MQNSDSSAVTQESDLHRREVNAGARFEFGHNWSRFLSVVDEKRIGEAEDTLRRMLESPTLEGTSFLDVGSGSGLFSLAARRLGARVRSFDFDPQSVACTTELRRRYYAGDGAWIVERGSVLDPVYLGTLGRFDVVYSWGVLHHTGRMWDALTNVAGLVRPGGKLFIAIYNDTGTQAARWKGIKQTYNRLPRWFRVPFTLAVTAPGEMRALMGSLIRARPSEYVERWTRYSDQRGMSRWHDIVDWVGGHPYEVATPEQIFDFYRARQFTLEKLKCGGVGLGCNEFVFSRTKAGCS